MRFGFEELHFRQVPVRKWHICWRALRRIILVSGSSEQAVYLVVIGLFCDVTHITRAAGSRVRRSLYSCSLGCWLRFTLQCALVLFLSISVFLFVSCFQVWSYVRPNRACSRWQPSAFFSILFRLTLKALSLSLRLFFFYHGRQMISISPPSANFAS